MYLKLASGNLLPKAWGDLYQRFRSAIAAKEGRDVLAKAAPSSFSNVEKDKKGMTHF